MVNRFDEFASLAVIQPDDIRPLHHNRLDGSTRAVVGDVLAEMPVEVAFGERRVVPRQRGQHLVGIAGRCLVRPPQRLGPFGDAGLRLAHPHRPDVLRRMRGGRIHPKIQAVLAEIPVLMVAPQRAPDLAVGHHGASAGAPYFGVEVPRLLRRERRPLDAPRGDQQMRVPVRALGVRFSLMRRVHVELHGEAR